MAEVNRKYGYCWVTVKIHMPIRTDAFGRSVWPLARSARVGLRYWRDAGGPTRGHTGKGIMELKPKVKAPPRMSRDSLLELQDRNKPR